MEAKKESSLGAYLGKPPTSPLSKVNMQVSDVEKAEQITNDNLERLRGAGDRIAYLKEKMYYPKEVDDIFLNEDSNIFPVEACKRQKTKLQNMEFTGTPVILTHDETGQVVHEFTDKLPISNFPMKPSDDKNAPVVIYEFPIANPPYGLYVAGVDPYRQGQARYSDSLGTVYIYKRMHSIISEKYQNMFVASYAARPDRKETWEEQARLLIKYYNARTLCENDEISFIEYMKAKGDARYLERQPDWLKEIVPGTSVTREYGLHRSAEKIRNYLHTGWKNNLEEVAYREEDENGSVISEIYGVNKVLDPMLLEETIQYNEDGNFDRIVAAELAIALANKLDPIIGAVREGNDERLQSLRNRKPANVLFPKGSNLFVNRKRKLFT